LATAILYWDEMYTIVLESIADPYQTPETQAAREYGFLRPHFVNSDSPEVITASKEFLADIERRAIIQDRRDVNGWSLHARPLRAVHLHPSKMSVLLQQGVLSEGNQAGRSGFRLVPEDVGLPYMARLGAVIADQRGWKPLTERPASRATLLDRSVDILRGQGMARAEGALATLSIDTVRISSAVPLGELWAFRESHYGELRRYRRALRSLAQRIATLSDSGDLLRVAEGIVEDDILPAEEEVTRKLDEAGVSYRLSGAELTALGVVALMSNAVQGLGAALATIGVGLAFAACRKRIARRRAWEAPMSYLLKARRHFAG